MTATVEPYLLTLISVSKCQHMLAFTNLVKQSFSKNSEQVSSFVASAWNLVLMSPEVVLTVFIYSTNGDNKFRQIGSTVLKPRPAWTPLTLDHFHCNGWWNDHLSSESLLVSSWSENEFWISAVASASVIWSFLVWDWEYASKNSLFSFSNSFHTAKSITKSYCSYMQFVSFQNSFILSKQVNYPLPFKSEVPSLSFILRADSYRIIYTTLEYLSKAMLLHACIW